jgi:hypothetical protein
MLVTGRRRSGASGGAGSGLPRGPADAYAQVTGAQEAAMSYVRCKSPTCRDSMQGFRDLEGSEIPAAGEALEDVLEDEPFVARAFHRCSAPGCRRVQRKNDYRQGGCLPPGF